MLNFLVAFFSLNFLRKNLNTQQKLPKLDPFIKIIGYFLVPVLLAISFALKDKLDSLVNILWFAVFSFIIYVLWLLRNNNLAFSLLKAGFPFYVINTLNNVLEFFAKDFLDSYSNVADLISLGGILWMVAFSISANNQMKELKKEEEKNKIVTDENEKLELMVKERTSEILAQKAQLENTLEELKATQNQLVQQEKLASLGELTAGIAHEIQNPLNFVNNFSELNVELIGELREILARTKQDEIAELIAELLSDVTQNTEKINFHGKRAASIVKGMLQHSRTSTGQKEPTDVNALADEFLRLSYHGLRAKDKSFNADFKTDFKTDLPIVVAVPQDLGRVFLNLINNAFYACNERSKTESQTGSKSNYKPVVKVSTKLIDGVIEIRISDNGVGISQENMEKIFQPFFTTKPTGKGTGLGLSLAYDIITKGHGGTLEVESEEGEGTAFIIKLNV